MALTQVDQGLLGQYAQYTGFKNRIINGDMRIDQRNAGASVTPTNGGYTLDRWKFFLSQASKLTCQQNAGAVTPPAGFSNYLGVTSSSAYSVLSGDYFGINQPIEGFNGSDLAWGTASASSITISFWVRSSLTGSFGGSLNSGTRCYAFSYNINSANTWEYKTVTIAGDQSGTWSNGNGLFVEVRFGLGAGSSFTGTGGVWQASNLVQPTGTTSVVGTNGATFYITGVQLEKGSTATSFDYRPYGTELQLCQRYCYAAKPVANGAIIGLGQAYSATAAIIGINVPSPMRSTPTLTRNGLSVWNANVGSDLAVSAATIADGTPSFVRIDVTVASGLAAGNAVFLEGTTTPSGTGYLILSSEL